MRFTLLAIFVLYSSQLLAQRPTKFQWSEDANQRGSTVELIRAAEGEYISLLESEEGVFIMSGGVILRIPGQEIRADSVKINPATGEVYASGGVTVDDGVQVVEGTEFIYDSRLKQGVLYGAKSNYEPIYLLGESFDILSEDVFRARAAFFSTCAADNPHYYFKASKLYLTEDQQFVAINAIYYVGHVPLFYLPVLFQTDFGTGINTSYGNNSSQGHFLQNTYFMGTLNVLDNKVFDRAKLMADFYQYSGLFAGAHLIRDGEFFNYDIEIGLADYKKRTTLSNGLTSNQILQTDGTRKVEKETWHRAKVQTEVKWNSSFQQDWHSGIYLQLESSSHPNFEDEFLRRLEAPAGTIDALTRNTPILAGTGNRNLNWKFIYNDDWGNNHLNVTVSRTLAFYEFSDNSRFLPTYALEPSLSYSRRDQILSPSGYFGGLWNDISFSGKFERYYSSGDNSKNLMTNSVQNNLTMFFPFTSWLSLQPVVGYGAQNQYAAKSDTATEAEALRQSFQFLFYSNSLKAGVPELHSIIGHRVKYVFEEGTPDPTFGNIPDHLVDFKLRSDWESLGFTEAYTARDMREYPYVFPERFRWSNLVLKTGLYYDFIRGFDANNFGIRKRKYYHFSTISLDNKLQYLVNYDKWGTNQLSIGYQFGGIKVPLIKSISEIKTSLEWYHDYIDVRQNKLFFNWSGEFWLHRYWFLSIGSRSSADEMERYRSGSANYVSLWQDLLNGLNFFDSASQKNTVFNLQSFYAELEHDLHRWTFKIGFSADRRTILYGSQLRDRASYYEKTVYFSFYLNDFPGFGIDRNELYRFNPADSGAI